MSRKSESKAKSFAIDDCARQMDSDYKVVPMLWKEKFDRTQ